MAFIEEGFIKKLLEKEPRLVVLLSEISEFTLEKEPHIYSNFVEHMFEYKSDTYLHNNLIIIYIFCNVILKSIQLKNAFILLIQNNLLIPAFSISRLIFEHWASTVFIKSSMRDYLDTKDIDKITKIAEKFALSKMLQIL